MIDYIQETHNPLAKSLLRAACQHFYKSAWPRENRHQIGMLIEPRAIISSTYQFIKNYNKKFEFVLTYDRELLELGKNFSFYPHGGCWIKPTDQKIYSKSKVLSTIASRKKNTTGHKLRHKIINQHKANMDVYGIAYYPIPNKILALKDYMFSLTIENCKLDYYFTEKLIDCFMTGVIPIYWGCPSIGNFFDLQGMIIINEGSDFDRVINLLNRDLYKSKLESIKNNFETAKKYLIAEDWIYENLKIFQ
jgi:hypothetical protein